MEALETVEVDSPKVACDGARGALGHPRVYLNMGDKGFVDCPYCDRHYTLKAGAKADVGH